jgi:hypothetical protein
MILELTAVRQDGSASNVRQAVQSVRWPRGFSGTVRVTCTNADGTPTDTTDRRQRLTIRRFLTDEEPVICLESTSWDFEITGTLANQIPGRFFYDVIQIDEDDGTRFEVVLTGPWEFTAVASIVGDLPMDPVGEIIPPPVEGQQGATGLSVLHGSGPPDPNFGRDDEFYIDDTSPGRDFYGPKTAGDWGDPFPLITVGAALSDLDPVANALVADPGDGLYSSRNNHVHPYTIAVAGVSDGWMSGTMAQQLTGLVAADFGQQITNVADDLEALSVTVDGHTTAIGSQSSAISALQGNTVTAGAGLTGGGAFGGNPTINVGQHVDGSIVVGADDVRLSPTLQTAISTNTTDVAALSSTVTALSSTQAAQDAAIATLGAVNYVGGAGLVGGSGALSLGGTRTFDIGQNADNSVVVNVSDIQINPALQTAISASTSNVAALTGVVAGHTSTLSAYGSAIDTLEGIELEAGAGMTGGGFLNGSKVTFNIGEHFDSSITVEADAIRVSTALQTAITTTADDLEALTAVVDDLVANGGGGGGGSSVPLSRTLTPGAGLVGSAALDLSADRTFDIGQNADGSIVVNADDIQVGILATDAQHGDRGGGTLHADVVASGASGFMSGAQAAQLATNTSAIATLTTDVATDSARIATWSDCRYWFVDYDGGSDTNTGFIDATAGTTFTGGQLVGVPFKTLERFFAVCPKLGSGKRIVLLVKPRASAAAYLKADGLTADSIDWTGFVGYRMRLSRASTDLTNSVTDRILCGFTQAITGPGAGGSYLALAGATTSSMSVTGTPFTANALAGWRIRFLGDVTAGLANVCVNIRDNTTSLINFGDTVTTPATNDSFVIEMPGIPVWQYLSNDIAAGQTYGDPILNTPISGEAPTECCDVGFEVRSTTNLAYQMTGPGFKACCGIETSDVTLSLATSTQFHMADMHRAAIRKSYVDETGVNRLVGMGARARNGWLIDRITCLEAAEAFAWVNAGGAIGAIPPRLVNITCVGTGGIFNKGSFLGSRWRFLNIGMGGNGVAASIFPGTLIGGGTSGIRSRSVNSIAPNASNVAIQGWEFSDCTQNCIQINNSGAMRGCSLAIDNCIGTTGNLGFGIDVTGPLGCFIFLGTGAANTMSGTSGEITLPGAVTTTHASFATIGYKDQQGNTYYGSFTNTTSDQAILLTNVDGTALALGEVVRKTSTSTQVVRAKADTNANASGALFVAVTPPANSAAGYFVAMNATQKWVLHNAAPTLAALSYLSAATGGLATTTTIAVSGTNQKRRLGHVVKVSGSLGLVVGSPELLPVTSDGNA